MCPNEGRIQERLETRIEKPRRELIVVQGQVQESNSDGYLDYLRLKL